MKIPVRPNSSKNEPVASIFNFHMYISQIHQYGCQYPQMFLFHIEKQRHHGILCFGKRKLLRFSERRVFNRENCRRNRELLEAILAATNCEKPGILFVANNVQQYGGVETRLAALISELKQHGFAVYLMTEEGESQNAALSRETVPCPMRFHAGNLGEILIEFVRARRIKVVEFQFKTSRYLRDIDLRELSSHTVSGCTIHGKGNYEWAQIRLLDYRVFISERLRIFYGMSQEEAEIVPNAAPFMPPAWCFGNQKKAVYIARIGKGKNPHLIAFLEFCRANRLEFDIAGGGKNERQLREIAARLCRKYDFTPECFIGAVDTRTFLKDHAGEYLLTAGVGLVIAEAAMLGYPSLILSDCGLKWSTFLAPENLPHFSERNFTIRKQPIPRTLDLSRLEEYSLHEEVAKVRNLETIATTYRGFLEKRIEAKQKNGASLPEPPPCKFLCE